MSLRWLGWRQLTDALFELTLDRMRLRHRRRHHHRFIQRLADRRIGIDGWFDIGGLVIVLHPILLGMVRIVESVIGIILRHSQNRLEGKGKGGMETVVDVSVRQSMRERCLLICCDLSLSLSPPNWW